MKIIEGERLRRPQRDRMWNGDDLPDDTWQLLEICAERDASKRPRASEVVRTMSGNEDEFIEINADELLLESSHRPVDEHADRAARDLVQRLSLADFDSLPDHVVSLMDRAGDGGDNRSLVQAFSLVCQHAISQDSGSESYALLFRKMVERWAVVGPHKNHVYRIVNVRHGICTDLKRSNLVTIFGFTYLGGSNQKVRPLAKCLPTAYGLTRLVAVGSRATWVELGHPMSGRQQSQPIYWY
jgi:hypothetical protein